MSGPSRIALVSGLIVACGGSANEAPRSPSAAPPASPRHDDAGTAAPALAYPAARTLPLVERLHGVDVADPYRWLEDETSGEVKQWMHAEDDLARRELSRIPIREAFLSRLKELAHRDVQDVPVRLGRRLFYSRRAADRDRWAVYWREGDEATDHVLLDPDQWATDGSLSLGDWNVSPDGAKVVYQVKQNNLDAATLHVMDVATGRVSPADAIDGAEVANTQWSAKSDGFYYVRVPTDPAVHATRFARSEGRFHRLGEDAAHDRLVLPSKGAFLSLSLGPEGRWLIASVSRGWSRNDLYVEDLREQRPTWRPLVENRNASFDVRGAGDTLLVFSQEGAPNGEIYSVDPRKLDSSSWRKIVPERANQPLVGFDVIGHRLVLRYLENVIPRVEVRALDGSLVRTLPMRGLGTTLFPSGTATEDEAYYGFESWDRPLAIYKTSIRTGDTSLWSEEHVPADLSGVQLEQVFYSSKDGTRVPMFIVHPRGMKRDGTAKAILSGYGGFNQAYKPQWDPSILPWIERGGVYAVANLRGGSEYGEAWHRAGMLENKQHVFDDFIAAAEYLEREGYTSPDRLASSGASNGGLLVAATLVQRPELFAAAICGEPLTDMIRYPIFGRGGIPELGDPDDASQFRALLAYSPYHHVTTDARYPAVLVTASASDERNGVMHALKLTAVLQRANASAAAPTLLRIDWASGHMGTDSVSLALEKLADEYAFVWAELGRARQ